MTDPNGKIEENNGNGIRKSELRYRRLFETAQDGILILDAITGMITDVNPFLTNMLGYSREEFLQKKLWEVGAFKDIEASQEAFQLLQKNTYIRYEDLPLRAKDGHLVQVEFISNVYLVGETNVIQCNIRDITERKHAQDALVESKARLRAQSFKDYLTGLYKPDFMEELLDHELLRAGSKNAHLGILQLDVDHFNEVNHAGGYSKGDEILRDLTNLILEVTRPEDIPCRYGGDEFLIILPDTTLEDLRARAVLLRDKARDLKIWTPERKLLPVSISIGLAVFPENGRTSQEILAAAEKATYRAKNQGAGAIST